MYPLSDVRHMEHESCLPFIAMIDYTYGALQTFDHSERDVAKHF